jgi:hypothetical protein
MTLWHPTQANLRGRSSLGIGFGVEHAGQGITGVLSVIASSTIFFLDLGLVTEVTHQITMTTAVAPPTITEEKASK